jgi:protein farnesyltransferase/geranylgeranyltransferase type-1 subunit alpha
MARHQYAQ